MIFVYCFLCLYLGFALFQSNRINTDIGIVNRLGAAQADEHISVGSIAIPDLSIPQLLSRDQNFSLFVPMHRRAAARLIEIFMGKHISVGSIAREEGSDTHLTHVCSLLQSVENRERVGKKPKLSASTVGFISCRARLITMKLPHYSLVAPANIMVVSLFLQLMKATMLAESSSFFHSFPIF